MAENIVNNRRIAKNTILLYLRMLIMMLIGLLTTRYLLKALGVENLGIYNVVGGVVSVLAFLNSAMTSASTRFISVALASNHVEERRVVFSTTFMMHFYIDIIVLVLLETIGLWFVNNYLVIPQDRIYAANVVYQLSVFSCFLSILLVPYSATLVSNEKMGVYAYFSIFDVGFKFVLTIAVCLYDGDRLILYGALIFLSFLVNYILNLWYCIKRFDECRHLSFVLNKECAKGITKYLGWSMYTNTAHISYLHGLNILLNLFFGPAANASRQIAGSIQEKLMSFVDNFQMAVNPQIIKSYAAGLYQQVFELLYQSERITFYMMSVMMIPIWLTVDDILYIWLGQIPKYSDVFCQLILAMSFVNALSNPFMKVIQADGRLKKNSLITGTALFLILPLSYVALKMGFDAPSVYVVNLLIYILAYLIRLKIVYDLIRYDVYDYFKVCIIKPISVVAIPCFVGVVVSAIITHTIINVIIFDCLLVMLISFFIYIFGLELKEKVFIKEKIHTFVNKIHR